MKIFAALLAIQRGIHSTGVGKTRTNSEQKFKFRGIDDALYAFAPLLTEHGVLLAPRYHDIVVTPRQTKSGGTTFNVQMQGTFTFTCAEDGSERTVGPFYGEANDGQDKAISKAESVALRQMFFHTFAVPHEPVIGGDPDEYSEDEPAEDYTHFLAELAKAGSGEAVRAVKADMLASFGGVVPQPLVKAYNERVAELKAKAEAVPA